MTLAGPLGSRRRCRTSPTTNPARCKRSNPTETSASNTNPYSWAATGDDATDGWLYFQQTYDWKGRPLVTTNTDNTFKSASYGGCGCAGGQVVTLTDEVNRKQKIYADVLG